MQGLIRFLAGTAPMASPDVTADALFVYAGGQARKEHAAAAWRRGVAPVLVVSVARFEWRRYALLGLPGMDALQAAVEIVPPRERHFFVILENARVTVRRVVVHRFGTRNEARALAVLVRERGWRRLLVVSSAFHLRRVALATARALQDKERLHGTEGLQGEDAPLHGGGIEVVYATPCVGADPHGPGRWWRTRRGLRLVFSEIGKLAIYRFFLRP